jgi:hypothetical protein
MIRSRLGRFRLIRIAPRDGRSALFSSILIERAIRSIGFLASPQCSLARSFASFHSIIDPKSSRGGKSVENRRSATKRSSFRSVTIATR